MRLVNLQQHVMSAAFTHGSSHGWVYVETTMTPTFQHLLLLILWVIRSHRGLIKFPIDLLDHVSAIMLPKLIEDHFEVECWVQVLQDPYKGNIGLVNSVQTWGVSLLLIPRWYDRCAAVRENPLFPQFCQYKEYNAGPFYKHILLELMVLLAI